MIDHRQIDERSLAFGKLLAAKISVNPEVIGVAQSNLKRWMMTCSPRLRSTLQEWLELLDGPGETLKAVLTSRDERSVRLRQSNPFAGVLSPGERNAILVQFHRDEATRA